MTGWPPPAEGRSPSPRLSLYQIYVSGMVEADIAIQAYPPCAYELPELASPPSPPRPEPTLRRPRPPRGRRLGLGNAPPGRPDPDSTCEEECGDELWFCVKGIGEEWTRDGERVAARREKCKVPRIEKELN